MQHSKAIEDVMIGVLAAALLALTVGAGSSVPRRTLRPDRQAIWYIQQGNPLSLRSR